MITLIGIELYKLFKKWRTYIGFIAITVLVPIIQIAISIEEQKTLNFMTRSIQQSFLFVGNFLNSYLVSYLIMNSLYIHIPFLVTLAAGDLLAGEATAGTYRMLLTRPVSRFNVVTSKFLAGIIYTFLLVMWLAVLSLGIGTLIFGTGELIVMKSSALIIFSRNDILWRFASAYIFAVISMSVVTSLAFLFSSLVENSIGPIITTMAIIIAFIIISAIDVNAFRIIKPYLFTSYMGAWSSFFDKPADLETAWKAIGVLSAHIIILFSITLYIFKKKDILT